MRILKTFYTAAADGVPIGYTLTAEPESLSIGLVSGLWHIPIFTGTLLGERGEKNKKE